MKENLSPLYQPTVDNDSDISLETHILNFNQDIYGAMLGIQLFFKIRSPQKFRDLSALLEQIRSDCLAVQEFWGIKPAISRLIFCICSFPIQM